MLEVKGLGCERGDRRLFQDIDFKVEGGTLLYVEGHNGSGKTTMLRALSGLLMPTEGEIYWDGTEIRKLGDEYRGKILYLGHLNGIKLDLSCLENLDFNSRINDERHPKETLMDALDSIGLRGFEDLPARMLSQGQKRRIALAQLLVSETLLWILDEPFTALDVAAVDQLQTVIQQHLERNGIVILTTHQEVRLTSGAVNRLKLGGAPDA